MGMYGGMAAPGQPAERKQPQMPEVGPVGRNVIANVERICRERNLSMRKLSTVPADGHQVRVCLAAETLIAAMMDGLSAPAASEADAPGCGEDLSATDLPDIRP